MQASRVGVLLLSATALIAATASLPRTGIDRAGRKLWRDVLHWPDECEEAFDYPDESFGGIDVMELGKDRAFVHVVCTLGAYQGNQLFYVFDESQSPPAARAVELRVYGDAGEGRKPSFSEASEIWGTVDLDAAKKQLRITNRFSGFGDCGTWSHYDVASGDAALVELRAKLDCDGERGDPETWPVVKIH